MKTFGKFKIVAIASLSAIALAASIAVAQSVKTDGTQDQGQKSQGRHRRGGRGGHDKHGFGGMRGGFIHKLNLTDDQKAKMKQLRQNAAASNKPLREQLRAKRQELRQANEGGTFNEALASQKLTEMAGLEAKLMGENFKLHQEMQGLLTAEQKSQLEQMKAQSRDNRGQGPRKNGRRNKQ